MREIKFREIKFRAWNIQENRWMTCDEILGRVLVNPARDGKYFLIDENLMNGLSRDIGYGFDLMQYTGLKDKNGKEIYEGDIYESEDGRDRGVIVFQNCSFEVKWIPPVTFGLRSLLYYNQQGKVIGNIYENPDLVGDHDGD